MGGNLFYGTGIPATVLFINRYKAASRRGKVLLINGDKEFIPGTNQNSLSDENVARLADAVRRFEDEALFCRVVPIEEIEENGYNLNLTRYVQTDAAADCIDVRVAVAKLKSLTAAREAAEAKMARLLQELGYGD